MALNISTPSSPDDFALMPHTRAKLEAVLDGTVKFPGNGVSALLLYGVYGSGKTTMAKLLPGWLETVKTTPVLQSIPVGSIIDSTQPNIDFYSCAQGQNGASLIGQIQSHVMTMSFNPSCLHYVILDEVDNLTAAAHASLKAIMNYTHVVFVLTTNHLNKVDPGVINRSIVLDMNSAPTSAWVSKIKSIYAASGKTPPTDQAIAGVVNAGNGSARTILTDIEITQSIRERQLEDE